MANSDKTKIDVSFTPTKKGLYVKTEGEKRLLCPRIRVIASGPFEGDDIQHFVIRFKKMDKKIDFLVLQKSDALYPMRVMGRLADANFAVPSSPKDRGLLVRYINEALPEKTALLTKRTGWHEDIFVTPDKTYGESDWGIIKSFPVFRQEGIFTTGGELDEWKETVANPAGASSRLMFAIGAAFAASLLKFSDVESGGFHLVGETSIGKTTALIVAQSVWGRAVREKLATWDVKNAGLEEVTQGHCDILLCLDEIALAAESSRGAATRIRNVSFKSSSGQGTRRSVRYQPPNYAHAEWRTLILSTGETSLSDISAAGGLKRLGGEAVRFIDLPARVNPAWGIFEKLPTGSEGSEEAVIAIEEACKVAFGMAGPAFIEAILDDLDAIKKRVSKLMSSFFAEQNMEGVGGREGRFAKRFALIYAALVMAAEFKIVPWKRKAIMRAVTACYLDALAATNKADQSIEKSLNRLRKKLRSSTRVQDIEGSVEPATKKKPFAYRVKRKEGTFFAIKAKRFEKFMGSPSNARVVLRTLKKSENLVTQAKSNRLVKHVEIKGLGRKTYYCIREEFLVDDDH